MIGDLATAVGLDHWDRCAMKQVFCLTSLPLGINRLMLQQPDFIRSCIIPLIGKILHGLPGFQIGANTEITDDEGRLLQI